MTPFSKILMIPAVGEVKASAGVVTIRNYELGIMNYELKTTNEISD